MLDRAVTLLSQDQIALGLERLLNIEILIRLDEDDPPHIKEEKMAYFDLVFSSYKALPHNHEIHIQHKLFRIHRAYSLVQSYFTRQQIDEASYVLIDMHGVYESILEDAKPDIKQKKLDKFRSALDLFRKLVQSGKLDKKYGVALPRLEQEYTLIHEYAKPTERMPAAIPAGV